VKRGCGGGVTMGRCWSPVVGGNSGVGDSRVGAVSSEARASHCSCRRESEIDGKTGTGMGGKDVGTESKRE